MGSVNPYLGRISEKEGCQQALDWRIGVTRIENKRIRDVVERETNLVI